MLLEKITKYHFNILPDEYRSDYLDSAFPYERLIIRDVMIDLTQKTVDGKVSVIIDRDLFGEKYSWPANTAYRAAVQLGLGYIGLYLDMTKEEVGEVFQTEHHSYSRKALYGEYDKLFHVRFEELHTRSEKTFGRMSYRIDDSSFSGEIRFAIGFRSKKDKAETIPYYSIMECIMIDLFTPLDAFYNYSVKVFFGLTSMYDKVIGKEKAETFGQIYSAISKAKKRKTRKLIRAYYANHGIMPEKYVKICKRSLCGMMRMYLAKNH